VKNININLTYDQVIVRNTPLGCECAAKILALELILTNTIIDKY
jgi:hypothetical protein